MNSIIDCDKMYRKLLSKGQSQIVLLNGKELKRERTTRTRCGVR